MYLFQEFQTKSKKPWKIWSGSYQILCLVMYHKMRLADETSVQLAPQTDESMHECLSEASNKDKLLKSSLC